MSKYVYCSLALAFGILLSGNPTFSKIDPKIVSILGWLAAILIYSKKGEIN